MEKIIHFTVPAKLTLLQSQTIEIAQKLHPMWDIKVWQDPMQPGDYPLRKYWSKANSGAQLSDLLRLDVLYKWGGVYIDSDLRLLKPLDELVDKFDFFIASHDGIVPINAVIGARKAHPSLQILIEELLLNEPDWSLPPDKTTGPDIFVRTLKWDKRVTVLPRETFYSYGPTEAHLKKNHRHSYGEHLWDYSWKHLAKPAIPTFAWRRGVKRLMKPPLISCFRAWHRIKSLDPSASNYLWQPKTYAVSDEIVIKTRYDFTIIVDGNDTSVTPEIIFGDYCEHREEKFVSATLRGGDWVIGVDSSGGIFLMLAAQRVQSFGRVFGCAPNPKTMKLLFKSALTNRMDDRFVLMAGDGVVAPEGDAQLGNAKDIKSTLRVGDKAVPSGNSTIINVPCVTLDQEFSVDLPIKLLKIDAEGQEVALLMGARRLLERRCIDFILIKILREVPEDFRWRRELGGDRCKKLLAQLRQLTEANYIACTIAKDGSLVEHSSATIALDNSESCHLVLKARDQYTFES